MTKSQEDDPVRAYLAGLGKAGGKRRAALRTTAEIAKWGSMGGRPRALDSEALALLRKLVSEGKTQTEISEQLGVSLSTVVRAMKREGQGNPASD